MKTRKKKPYKIEAVMIVRPYLTIWAETKKDAERLFYEGQFDHQEFLNTCFPASDMHIDEIYKKEADACAVRVV